MPPAKCLVGTDKCPNKVNSLSCITCRKLQEEKTVAVFDDKQKSDLSFFRKKEPSKYQREKKRIYLGRTKGSGNTSHSVLMSKKNISDKTLNDQNDINKFALIKKKCKLYAGEESDDEKTDEETDWDSPIENINISDDASNSDIEEIYSVHPYLSDEEQDKEKRVVDSPSKEKMIVDLPSENESIVDLLSEEEKAVNSLSEDELVVNSLPKKKRVIDSLSKDKRVGSIQKTSKKRKVDVIYPPGPSCSSTVMKTPCRIKSTQSLTRKILSTSNGKSQKTVKTSKVSKSSSSISRSNIIYPPGPSCSSKVMKNPSRAKSTQSQAKSTQSRAKSTQSLTRKMSNTSNGKSEKTVKTSNVSKSFSSTSKSPNKKRNVAKKSARIVSDEVRNLTDVVRRLEQELEQLKKADTSNGKNSRTSYRNNMSGVLNSGTGSSGRTFVTEEDNSQLRTEIEELTDKLSKVQEKILNAKMSEDRKKRKEKLMKEVENLEQSCKNAEKLRKLNCVKYKKKMIALEKEFCAQPDPYTREAKWLRCLIRCNKGKLMQYEPKPPPKPKPDPYKTPEHLLRHRKLESIIEKNEDEAAPLKEEITKSEAVMNKISDVLLDQRKKNYILSDVLCALIKKFDEACNHTDTDDFSIGSDEYFDFNKRIEREIRDSEVAATKKAEKEYEEKVARGASEMEFKSKYNPSDKYYDLRSTKAINRLLLAFLR